MGSAAESTCRWRLSLVYLFNGIEPTDGSWILQPVLQWGYNNAFGGDYWVIASWFAGPPNYSAFYSQPEVVFPGDTIKGTTGITAEVDGISSWVVSTEDLTLSVGTYLGTQSAWLQWNWAFAGVLEVYNLISCSQFPAAPFTKFQGTYLYHGYPQFLSANANPWFGKTQLYGGPSCGLWGLGAAGYGANPGTALLVY